MYNRIFDKRQGAYVPREKPELNYVYAYKSRNKLGFRQKQQDAEYKYKENGAIIISELGEIYIYSNTYTIDGVTNGLLLVTKEKRKTYVEKFFKEVVKEVETNLDFLEKFKKAHKPTKLQIAYHFSD